MTQIVRRQDLEVGGGGSVELLTSTIERQRKMITQVRVPDGQARSWAITLGTPEVTGEVIQSSILQAQRNADPFGPLVPAVNFGQLYALSADISWGVGGASFRALVDWRARGSVLVVHGSFVEVTVDCAALGLSSTLPFEAAGFPRVRCPASIVPATAMRSQVPPPTATVDMGQILVGGFRYFKVPGFARRMRLYRRAGANAFPSTEIGWFADGTVATGVGFLVVSNAAPAVEQFQLLEIPANAIAGYIRNLSANPETYALEFELDLG